MGGRVSDSVRVGVFAKAIGTGVTLIVFGILLGCAVGGAVAAYRLVSGLGQ